MKLCTCFFFLKNNMSFDRQTRGFFFRKYKHFCYGVFNFESVIAKLHTSVIFCSCKLKSIDMVSALKYHKKVAPTQFCKNKFDIVFIV